MELIRSNKGWRGDVRRWMKLMMNDGEVHALQRELREHIHEILVKYSADALVHIRNNTDRILINQEAHTLQQKRSETSLRELKQQFGAFSGQLDALKTQWGTGAGGPKAYEPPPIRPAQTLPGASRVEQDFWAQSLATPTLYSKPPQYYGPANRTQSLAPPTLYPKPPEHYKPANRTQSHALPTSYPKPPGDSRPRAHYFCPICYIDLESADGLIDHREIFGKHHCSRHGMYYEEPLVYYNHTQNKFVVCLSPGNFDFYRFDIGLFSL
jgi:hypothetical protein